MGSTFQQLPTPNMATYIGRGKLSEVKQAVAALNVDTVIFDDELNAGQLRNLEKFLNEGMEERGLPPVRVSACSCAHICWVYNIRVTNNTNNILLWVLPCKQ
jgi:GTP-binding protein HflX